MSGDPQVVLHGAGMDRLGAALARLADIDVPFTLVGGLAVMVRLATAHRATQDVDTVGDAAAIAVAATVPVDAHRITPSKLDLGGVEIDLIDVAVDESFADVVDAAGDVAERVFLVAHLWAHRAADLVSVEIAGHAATVNVARPDALIGGKVAARLSPRREASKHPSDAADLIRLLRLDLTNQRPAEVAEVLADGLRTAAVDQADRLVRDANRLLAPGQPRYDADTIAAVASHAAETLAG